MVDVETEVSKHKNCKERDKLEMAIKEYKSLALQHANNLSLASKYSTVAFRLQEICDKLPAPNLKVRTSSTQSAPTKTATISSEENTRIKNAWKQKTNKR
jgi:hypothetical protein